MVQASVGLAVRDSNVSPGSVFSPTFFSLFIYKMKKYILSIFVLPSYSSSIFVPSNIVIHLNIVIPLNIVVSLNIVF